MKKFSFPEEDGFLDEVPEESVFDELEDAPADTDYAEESYAPEESGDENYVEEEFIDEADAYPEESVHDRLTDPVTGEELSADDHAMYAAGLVHPEDAEFIYDDAEPLPEEIPAEPHQDTEYRDPEYQDGYAAESQPDTYGGDEMEPGVDPYEPEHHDRPAHKGRPKRRKGSGLFGIPHLIATVIWLVIIVAIGVSLGRMIWVCAADVLAFGREEQLVTVTITSDDDIESIADKLQEAGLIRYPGLFKIYADLAVDEGEITTGTFTLNTIYDYHALVNGMSPSSTSRKVVEDVLIPEGFTCRQIFDRLEENGVCKASELEAYAASGELDDYWFLEDVERGDKYCLEGYLFPATYDFYENSTPKQVLEKMLDAFDANYSEEMQAQLTTLNERLSEMMRKSGCTEDYIAANQLDMHDVVTVASLIEKEMASEDESRVIASVIYNRLTQDEAYERYLNIDAAIFYALDERKEALTAEDLQIDSPYNTYTNPGLVPGPISNPGLACLKAALDPEDTGYYYYVLDPDAGEHIFNKTYEDHEKAIEEINSRSTEADG
ncbi:MAG: endolytic transglycosylase MltG [Oscillospiraceae bacterium]|nr:endolytic transglycosylase MltG [Oscillospiraceae bacterium]